MSNENTDENESHFIEQVGLIDSEIASIEKRIVDMKANEAALLSALSAARKAEHTATNAYAQTPNERSQRSLENARDFTIACQKRVNLFSSDESILNGDAQMLWGQRRGIIDELSRFRTNKLRPQLEYEAEELIKIISEKSQRYLSLVALLDGQNVLRLDLDKLLIAYNQDHKSDLTNAAKTLHASFETLTKVEL